MNQLLSNKIEELENMGQFECWYLVKHKTDFPSVLYICSIFELCQERGERFSQKFSDYVQEINEKKKLKLSTNYRTIRIACFYGLLTPYSGGYENASLTDTYSEIKKRCDGQFEEVALYEDIIQRQLEKMFISTEIDEAYEGIRKDFRIYPVYFLYKILIELGMSTKSYSVTMNEYRYFIATTKRYEDFQTTLDYIKILREQKEKEDTGEEEKVIDELLETFKDKFDNRFNVALKQLKTLEFTKDSITLRPEYIPEVVQKLFLYELNQSEPKDYFKFLDSTEDLVQIPDDQPAVSKILTIPQVTIDKPHERIFIGAPGTGKSFKLNEERKKYFGKNYYKRVTFYPNYTYAQFVGTYKPVSQGEDISYSYVPGPFIELWKRAYLQPNENFLLVIEEINRANAAAVFGDLFQLLDRDKDSISEYKIDISFDLKNHLKEDGIDVDQLYLPNNFYIWATMNSSDQGVSPLDAAFKRRFEQEFVGINDGEDKINEYQVRINGLGNVNWNTFRKELNVILTTRNIREDKLIGPFFMKREVMENPVLFQNTFRNKMILTLAEDIFKHNLSAFFRYSSLSAIYEHYDNGANVFIDEFTVLEEDDQIEDLQVAEDIQRIDEIEQGSKVTESNIEEQEENVTFPVNETGQYILDDMFNEEDHNEN